MKTLVIDVETSPNISYTWGIWQQDVIEVKEQWKIICFAYKWLGQKKATVLSLSSKSEKELLKELWKVLNECDVVLTHNGDKFDIRKINAKLIEFGFTPPAPYKSIDTLKVAKKYFKFDSNRLDQIGKYFGVGRKIKTGGFDLWLGCMKDDKKSWGLMERYNKQDVILLEKVYLKMRGWIDNHPNTALYSGESNSCPNCGGKNIHRRGFAYKKTKKYQRFQCKTCGKWSQSRESMPGNVRFIN